MKKSTNLNHAGEDTAGLRGEPQYSTVKITLNFKRFIFDPQR